MQKQYTIRKFNGSNLQGLFQASPKLRILTMCGFDDGALPFIFQYCTGLVFLGHNSRSGTRSNLLQAYKKSDITPSTTIAPQRIPSPFFSRRLRCFNIGDISSGTLYVQSFLEAHQQTIRQITIDKNTANDWNFFFSTENA